MAPFWSWWAAATAHCILEEDENKGTLCVLYLYHVCVLYMLSSMCIICSKTGSFFFFFNPKGRLKTQNSARHPGTCLQSQHRESYARKIAMSGRNLACIVSTSKGHIVRPCLKSTQTAPGPGAREAPEGPPGVCAVCVQGSVPQGRVHEFWLIPEVQTLWHLLSPSLPVFPKETEGNICVTVFESKQLYQHLKLG